MSTLSSSKTQPPVPTDPRPVGGRSPLLARLDRLRRRVQRLLWIETIAAVVIAVSAILTGAVLIDWWWRPAGPAGRWTLTALVLIGVGASVAWSVWRIGRRRITALAVARRLEGSDVRLGDRLSSAVALDQHREAASGSNAGELADEAIHQAAMSLETIEPERRINRGPALRATLVATAVVAAILALYLWNPGSSGLAARRVFVPTSDVSWPRRDELRLENVPERVHAGEDVEIYVRNARGELPEDVEIQFRDAQGNVVSPPVKMSGDSGVAVWRDVEEDFQVRARGGDDSTMPWHGVRVLAAPRITDFTVNLTPPEYAGRPPIETVENRLTVLAGTTMTLDATVQPGVSTAEFIVSDTEGAGEIPAASSPDHHWPSAVTRAGTALTVGPIVLEHSGQYQFVWTDRNGLPGQSDTRWDITVQEDEVPRVEMVEPESDMEITSVARISLRRTAADDLGLAESWFEIRHVQRAIEGRVAIVQPPGLPRRQVATAEFSPAEWLAALTEQATATEQAAAMDQGSATLQSGDTLEVVAVAIDSAGQRGESTTRRLRVVSAESILDALAQTQHRAMEALREAADDQRIALEQTGAAKNRLGGDEQQRQSARDRLRAAESAQSATERRIRGDTTGVRHQIDRAIQTATENQLDGGALRELQRRVDEEIIQPVSDASAALDQASERLATGDTAGTGEALNTATQAQTAALEQLDRLVGEMRRGDARRAAAEELAELAAAQERLSNATTRIGEAADREQEGERLAARQRELAREADAITSRLGQLAESLEEQDPNVADQARDAAETLRAGQTTAADAMRQAAEEIARSRTGRANDLQQQATAQLERARQAFAGRADQSGQGASAEERAISLTAGLQSIAADQQTLVAEIMESPLPEQGETQTRISRETREVASRDDLPPGFGDALSDAAAEMELAAALLRRPASQSQAVDPASSALERLRFIRESLARDSTDRASAANPPASEDGGPEDPGGGAPQVPLSSLKLVRSTQEFLRQRTSQIAEQESDAADSVIDRARLQATKQALAQEQARLVQRIEEFAKSMTETDNQSLPAGVDGATTDAP